MSRDLHPLDNARAEHTRKKVQQSFVAPFRLLGYSDSNQE